MELTLLDAENLPREGWDAALATRPLPQCAALLDRVEGAKRSFVCRRVTLGDVRGLSLVGAPQSGDLVLAVVTEVGHHARLESPDGRRAQLYVGDEILVAYGERYAPDQCEAVVPDHLGPCDLVAGGGIAAKTLARHATMRRPTAITPIGLLTNAAGDAINLKQFALPAPAGRPIARNLIVVVGTSMNAGKTTAAASLIHGLSKSGLRVGACKLTGTGSGGDLWSMVDAGAARALDFTDVGFATTAGADMGMVEAGAHTLISELEASGVDIIVAEIADGLLQRETAALLSSPSTFAGRIDALVLAAADSMGALAGAEWLRTRNLPLRAVTGLVTASPLGMREAQSGVAVDVISTQALAEADRATRVCLKINPRQALSVVS